MNHQVSQITLIGDNEPTYYLDKQVVCLLYTNHKGVTAWRRVVPISPMMEFKVTPHHKPAQHVLHCIDLEKADHRTFAMSDIHLWLPEPLYNKWLEQFGSDVYDSDPEAELLGLLQGMRHLLAFHQLSDKSRYGYTNQEPTSKEGV